MVEGGLMKESEALPIEQLREQFNSLNLYPGGRSHIRHCRWCRALKRSLEGRWELSFDQTEWLEAHLLTELALHRG
ncbi:hypothetical protein ES708_35045 [subsurface metagenome]